MWVVQSIASADMDAAQLEAFLTAQTRRQGGGVSAEQGAVLSRFWRTQRTRVRESLLAQSRWEPSLRGLTWRVDLPTATSQGDRSAHGGPLALVELELGRAAQVRPLPLPGSVFSVLDGSRGPVPRGAGPPGPNVTLCLRQDSQFVCLELDEAGVNDVLKKMADIQSSLDRLVRHA